MCKLVDCGLWTLIYYEKIFPALFVRQKKILWRLLVFTAELPVIWRAGQMVDFGGNLWYNRCRMK